MATRCAEPTPQLFDSLDDRSRSHRVRARGAARWQGQCRAAVDRVAGARRRLPIAATPIAACAAAVAEPPVSRRPPAPPAAAPPIVVPLSTSAEPTPPTAPATRRRGRSRPARAVARSRRHDRPAGERSRRSGHQPRSRRGRVALAQGESARADQQRDSLALAGARDRDPGRVADPVAACRRERSARRASIRSNSTATRASRS